MFLQIMDCRENFTGYDILKTCQAFHRTVYFLIQTIHSVMITFVICIYLTCK